MKPLGTALLEAQIDHSWELFDNGLIDDNVSIIDTEYNIQCCLDDYFQIYSWNGEIVTYFSPMTKDTNLITSLLLNLLN